MNAVLGGTIFLILTWLCGNRCVRIAAPRADDPWQWLAQCFLFSFAWFSIFAFLAYLLHLSFPVFFLMYSLIALMFLFQTRNTNVSPDPDLPLFSRLTWYMPSLMFIGVLLLSALGGFFGGDGTFHQAKIQHLLQTQTFNNNDPYVQNVLDDRYAFSAWHGLIASALAGLNTPALRVTEVWYILPALLLPVVLASQYYFSSVLFYSRLAGCVTATLWLLHMLILAYTDERFWSDAQTLNYPSGVCIHALIPAGLALYIQWGERSLLSPRQWGGVLGGLALCIALVHLFYGMLFLASLVFLCLAVRLAETQYTRWLHYRVFPLLIASVFPACYFAVRYMTFTPIQNRFFEEPFGWKIKFLFLSDSTYILDPSLTFFTLGHYQSDRIVLCAILIALVALFLMRKERWLAYGALSTVSVVGALSLPPAIALLSMTVTAYKVPRLTLLIPTLVLITGAIVWLKQSRQGSSNPSKRIVLIVFTLSVSVWIYHDIGGRLDALWQQLRAGKMRQAVTDRNYTPIQRFWLEGAERPVIMGHESISYTLGAYAPVWAVHLPAAHAALGYPYTQRHEMYRFLTGESMTLFDLQRLAFDFDADYLILRHDVPIARQLAGNEIAVIGQFRVFPFPLRATFFLDRPPFPWLTPRRWITQASQEHHNPDAWGPGETVQPVQLPGSRLTYPTRILATDGLARSLIYHPRWSFPNDSPPEFLSFWIYLEHADPVVFDRIEVSWDEGEAEWSPSTLERFQHDRPLHQGWNAVLLAIDEAELRAGRHGMNLSEENAQKPGFKVSLICHNHTDSVQYIRCAIRDIHLYFRRVIQK